ncbi:hypothetical protein GCM10025868_02350 [Angustibacter aerolatus]|uniref:SUF system FeS cluster assembly SufBD core domain-containing protein n=1 Tax=Angustibacter aerolatus TaxID=1162965 RepID=A0ABQ6JDS5_9ACTN|nr:hypothetical protein GCM10025868_02350 [Angustibacter aerolatus]
MVSLQRWDDDAIHLAQHDAVVGRDARFKHVVVTLGGSVVRLNTNIAYGGPGAEATALGVYFADAGQHLEHRSFVDHNTPRCTSQVTYKGALQGDTAHTVWVGDVLIRAAAEGTSTYEPEPQPAAHRGRPRRLRAEPGDRDRSHRGRRPRQRHRPVRRRAACSTCRPAASPSRPRGASSCAASSTTSCSRSACPTCRSRRCSPSRTSLAMTMVGT